MLPSVQRWNGRRDAGPLRAAARRCASAASRSPFASAARAASWFRTSGRTSSSSAWSAMVCALPKVATLVEREVELPQQHRVRGAIERRARREAASRVHRAGARASRGHRLAEIVLGITRRLFGWHDQSVALTYFSGQKPRSRLAVVAFRRDAPRFAPASGRATRCGVRCCNALPPPPSSCSPASP